MRHFLSSFAVLALLLGGCQTSPTPEAVVYDTLTAASGALDIAWKSYVVDVKAGRRTIDQQLAFERKYNQAREAIAVAAEAAKQAQILNDPMAAAPSETTQRLVREVVTFFTIVIPPSP